MSKLYPKDWVETPVQKYKLTAQKKTSIKNKIKTFVDAPKAYREIIDYIQKDLHAENKYVGDEEIVILIQIVDAEWHPIMEVPKEL